MHISFSFVIYVMLRVTLKCTCHRSTYRDCHATQVCYLRLYFTIKTSLLSSVTMDDKNRLDLRIDSQVTITFRAWKIYVTGKMPLKNDPVFTDLQYKKSPSTF